MEIVVWKKGKEGFNMWFETSSVDDIEKFYVGNLVELTRRRHWYLTVFHDNGAKVLVDKERRLEPCTTVSMAQMNRLRQRI